MSVSCRTCPVVVACEALPHGLPDCQDNAARFNVHDCDRFPCVDFAEFGTCLSAPCHPSTVEKSAE